MAVSVYTKQHLSYLSHNTQHNQHNTSQYINITTNNPEETFGLFEIQDTSTEYDYH